MRSPLPFWPGIDICMRHRTQIRRPASGDEARARAGGGAVSLVRYACPPTPSPPLMEVGSDPFPTPTPITICPGPPARMLCEPTCCSTHQDVALCPAVGHRRRHGDIPRAYRQLPVAPTPVPEMRCVSSASPNRCRAAVSLRPEFGPSSGILLFPHHRPVPIAGPAAGRRAAVIPLAPIVAVVRVHVAPLCVRDAQHFNIPPHQYVAVRPLLHCA